MGAVIIQQVIKDLLPLGLENGTDLLLTGSSAGGTGVMINLDPVQDLLHNVLKMKQISVRGVTDSGWFLDRDPFISNGKPTVDAIRKGMQHWQGSVPDGCRQLYKNESWRCYFGYRLYPTLKSNANNTFNHCKILISLILVQILYLSFNGYLMKPKWMQITLELQ